MGDPDAVVANQLQYRGWWAQQMVLPNYTGVEDEWLLRQNSMSLYSDLKNSYKPMCVGDQDRRVMVKASVPKVNKIYEPVTSIYMDNEIVDALEGEGLCMGKDAATTPTASGPPDPILANSDLTYEESIFSVSELYQLCSVCAMMQNTSAAQTNGIDLDGWKTSAEAYGCIHPNTTVKSVTGTQICESVGNLSGAQLACAAIDEEDFPGWHDSCLAEFCLASGSAPGVHVEGQDAVNHVIDVLVTSAQEAADEAAEFGELD